MPSNNLGTAQGSIKINTSDLKNADIALRSAGQSMVGFGVAAVGAFGAIVMEAAKFEKEMDFVQAVTAASGEEMDALKDKAIELGKSSIFGPVALSQAFVELAKAGASVEDIIAGVGEASVNLATAADVEIPFAGENLINILNTFKLGAEDAVRVSDLLAGAANASSVELSDIVTTMRYAGPVAQAMGISLEEVNQALTVLGRVGIKGSTAGTSLRFAMTRLVPDTDKAKEAITGLGLHIDEATGSVVEFSNTDGSLKDLAEVFQVLQEATAGLNEQQKIAVINDIFGVRAMPSVLELMNAGREGFAELNDEINRTTAADVAAKRMDNLDGSIKRLKATISAIMIDAGGPFQGVLKDWVDGLRDLLLAFDALPGPVKTFLISALLGVGVLSLLAGGFLLTIGNIVRAVRVVGEITNAFALMAGGMRGAQGANAALSAGILASPWFWLVLAIAAVIAILVVLWFKWDAFREFIKDFWKDLKDVGKEIGKFFENLWNDVSSFFSNWEEHWNSAKEAVGRAWDAVKEFFSNIASAVGSNVADFFSGMWDHVLDGSDAAVRGVESVIGQIGEFFQSLPGIVGDGLEAAFWAFDDFINKLAGRLGFIVGWVAGRWIRLWFYDIPNAVVQAGIRVVTTAIAWGGQLLGWAAQLGLDVFTALYNWFSQLPGMFINFLTQMLVFFMELVPQMINLGFQLGGGLFDAIIGFVRQLPGQFINFMTQCLSFLIGLVPAFWGVAQSIGNAVLRGIVDLITGLPGTVRDIANRVIDVFTELVGDAFRSARDFASGLWNGFRSGLGINSPSYIEKALYAIQDESKLAETNLGRSIRSMSRMGADIQLNSRAAGIVPGLTQVLANGGTYNQNAPLIGVAHVRKEQDLYTLARELDNEERRKMRARGVTTNASQ